MTSIVRSRLNSLCWILTPLLLVSAGIAMGRQDPRHLRIGMSMALTDESKGHDTMESLKDFIRTETGFDNTFYRQRTWRELAGKMANRQLDLGVFTGFDFAWARQTHPELRPLALAVNVQTYRTVYVVAAKDAQALDFAGLKGQELALPKTINQDYLRLVANQLARANGKPLESYFAKVTQPPTIEDALDDVVDGLVQAAVVDRIGLFAFKRRKPARFSRLKEIAHSQALPPPVIAYHGTALDKITLERFRDGLLGASQKERGRELLTLLRLTSFETIPKDFDRVLAETRKNYPQPSERE